MPQGVNSPLAIGCCVQILTILNENFSTQDQIKQYELNSILTLTSPQNTWALKLNYYTFSNELTPLGMNSLSSA
jgi:hypothetical protein